LAGLTGCIVGWERESRGRAAGLRTNLLACVAAALAMVISEVLFTQSATAPGSGSWRPDPARLGAGVLTGIGFLGAGTILRHSNAILGVTTAASLWFVTVLGLAFGSGQYALGFIGVGIALLALYVLPMFEKHIQSDWFATLSVSATLEALDEEQLRNRVSVLGPALQSMRLSYDLEKKQKTFICELKLKRRDAFDLSRRVVADLADVPGVLRVKWF
jgi:putative Mg2+ transporter-C (MgtC) family protein